MARLPRDHGGAGELGLEGRSGRRGRRASAARRAQGAVTDERCRAGTVPAQEAVGDAGPRSNISVARSACISRGCFGPASGRCRCWAPGRARAAVCRSDGSLLHGSCSMSSRGASISRRCRRMGHAGARLTSVSIFDRRPGVTEQFQERAAATRGALRRGWRRPDKSSARAIASGRGRRKGSAQPAADEHALSAGLGQR